MHRDVTERLKRVAEGDNYITKLIEKDNYHCTLKFRRGRHATIIDLSRLYRVANSCGYDVEWYDENKNNLFLRLKTKLESVTAC